MITRTQNGYALGHWEAIPSRLRSGHNFTPAEARAAVCKLAGLSHKETARLMSCSTSNVRARWSDIYFKTGCRDAVTALIKLMDEGVLQRISLMLLALVMAVCATSVDHQIIRSRRPSRTEARLIRSRRETPDGHVIVPLNA